MDYNEQTEKLMTIVELRISGIIRNKIKFRLFIYCDLISIIYICGGLHIEALGHKNYRNGTPCIASF